jgi:hypothetical protein
MLAKGTVGLDTIDLHAWLHNSLCVGDAVRLCHHGRIVGQKSEVDADLISHQREAQSKKRKEHQRTFVMSKILAPDK